LLAERAAIREQQKLEDSLTSILTLPDDFQSVHPATGRAGSGTNLIVPLFHWQGMSDSQPVPMYFKIRGFIGRKQENLQCRRHNGSLKE
jgi:hypothetical protein